MNRRDSSRETGRRGRPRGGKAHSQTGFEALLTKAELPPEIKRAVRDELAERERVEEALRGSEAQLRAILDNAPMMIFTVDRRWRVREVNAAFEETSGGTVTGLLGATAGEALRCAHRLEGASCDEGPDCPVCPVRWAIKDTIDNGATRRGVEVSVPSDTASDRVLRISTAPLLVNGRRRALVWAEDVTRRRRAEQDLRESGAVLRVLVESTRSPIAVIDTERRLTAFNAAFAEMMRAAHGVECHAGMSVTDPLPPEERGWWLERIERALQGEFIRDEVVKKVGGVGRTFGVSLNPVVRGGRVTGVSQFARDITDRKEAEQALRRLSRRLLVAQEEERTRISRELHDEIGQVLTAVKIGLQRLERSDETVPHVRESILAIDRAIQDVRNLCVDLRPPLLDELGLETALRAHAERTARETGLDVEIATHGLEALPLELGIVCFRVVQESLTNVLRHSGATRVAVVATLDGGRLRLYVRDDGQGFDVGAALAERASGRSVGLAGMRERVDLLGGKLEIESTPGKGTEIRAWLPLGAPELGEERPRGEDAG